MMDTDFEFTKKIDIGKGKIKNCKCKVKGKKWTQETSQSDYKKKLMIATQTIGENIKVGAIEKIDYGTSNNISCECDLSNTINLNVEQVDKINGTQSIFIIVGLSFIIGALVYKNGIKNKANDNDVGTLGFLFAIGLGLIFIGSNYFSKYDWGKKGIISSILFWLILILLIVLVIYGTISSFNPTKEELKKYNNSKFYYFINKLFEKNFTLLFTGALFLCMIFWALSFTVTIPYMGVLLIVAMNIVLFGSAVINSGLSFVEFFKTSKWGFESNFWNMIGIFLTIGGLILNIIFYFNKSGYNTTSLFFHDWKKWLIHSDIIILLFFFITGIFTIAREEDSKLEMNRTLSSFVVAAVLYMVFKKNKEILTDNATEYWQDKDKDKDNSAKINLGAGTGILTDFLSKLYKVFFTKTQISSSEKGLGDEASNTVSFYWVVLYSFLNYFITDNVATEYNPSLFRTIFIVLIIVGRLCLGTFSTKSIELKNK